MKNKGKSPQAKAKETQPRRGSYEAPANHNIWARMGVMLHLHKWEIEKLFSESITPIEAAETVRCVLNEGRFSWDGDGYVPEPVIARYNDENGTDYSTNPVEWDI